MADDQLWAAVFDLLHDDAAPVDAGLWGIRDPLSLLPMPALLPPLPPTPPRSVPIPAFYPTPLDNEFEERLRQARQRLQQRTAVLDTADTIGNYQRLSRLVSNAANLPSAPASITRNNASSNSFTTTTRTTRTYALPTPPSTLGQLGSRSGSVLPPLSRRPNSPWSLGVSGGAPHTPPIASVQASLPPHPQAVPLDDDDFLASFSLAEDFSSPSAYPPANYSSSAGNSPFRDPGSTTTSSSRRPNPTLGSSTHNTGLNIPQPGFQSSLVLEREHSPVPKSPTDDIMPVSTRKRTAAGIAGNPDSSPAAKRRQTSQGRRGAAGKRKALSNVDLLFLDEDEDETKVDDDELEVIDLADTEEIPDGLKESRPDKRVKLSAFQCVICMDDASGLTVTHCGHLFCHQCLHSSLHIDAMKNKCPICRQKIETKPRGTYTTKTKGFWPLELKLMTVKRKGKQTVAGPSR